MKKEYTQGLLTFLVSVGVAALLITVDWTPLTSVTSEMSDSNFVSVGPFMVAVALQTEMPQVGENRLSIQVKDAQGNWLEGAKVRAVGEMPAMGSMPAMYAQADITEVSPGKYRGDFDLPMSGAWPLAIDIETDDAHHADLSFDMATGRKGLTLSSSTPSSDVAYHTCSMHPSVKSAVPGTCPICGMDLVKVTKEELTSGTITVEEGRRQLIGIKSGAVISEVFSLPITLQGEVTYDETRLTDISLRFDGWIGTLDANVEGKSVSKGEVLFTVYSPRLLSLQEEHLATFKKRNLNDQRNSLFVASRKRLMLWGLTASQISWLENKGETQDYLPIFSPADGVIIRKSIVDGSSFRQGENLLRMADISSLWVETYVYEKDLALIHKGAAAVITIPNLGGEEIHAKIAHIDPLIMNNTRSAKVRFEIDNASFVLRPGLFATATLQIDMGERLLVPVDAVLISGVKRIVFQDLGNGRLKPQAIKTSHNNGDMVIVSEGLALGDKIIISGNFLIAAESKLKLGIDQW
ncbi:hypothetical protein A9Q99_00060 [Gammaproteobacteria bacterium 45_16_T64]|nr:hypothetical protein A9Q99_00060 [Gammaproteobacteria bacterium 45_16_T64]